METIIKLDKYKKKNSTFGWLTITIVPKRGTKNVTKFFPFFCHVFCPFFLLLNEKKNQNEALQLQSLHLKKNRIERIGSRVVKRRDD